MQILQETDRQVGGNGRILQEIFFCRSGLCTADTELLPAEVTLNILFINVAYLALFLQDLPVSNTHSEKHPSSHYPVAVPFLESK